MAKKVDKIKMNVYGYVTIGLLIAVIVATIFLVLPTAKERIVSDFTNASLTIDHVYTEVSYDKFKSEIAGEGKVFVYFGSPSTDTNSLIATFNTNAKAFDIENILYVNIDKLNDSQMEEIRVLLRGINPDIKEVSDISTTDLWVLENSLMVDAYSKYDGLGLSDAYITRLIFQGK